MEHLRLNEITRPSAAIPGRLVSALLTTISSLSGWVIRKYRYALVADDLAAGPDYLLRDIGMTRGEIENLRRNGHPGDGRRN